MSLPAINPLFLGLLVGGVLLVIGVVLMNWLQERRVRRRIDAAFSKPAARTAIVSSRSSTMAAMRRLNPRL